MSAVRFCASIELGGKTATGFAVPDEIIDELGAGKRPPVRVTIGPHTYRTTVAVMGGRFMVPLSAENRTAAGVKAGDEVEVTLEHDAAPREVEIPPDLAKALKADPVAKKAFDALSFTYRKEHVRAIEDAKKPETRQRRIAKAIEQLRQPRR